MKDKDFKFTDKQKLLYDKCTNLQRKVVINVVQGNMKQSVAYKKAGGTAKTKECIEACASEILSHPNAKAFHDSILEREAGIAIMTRQRAMEILTCIGETKLTDVIEYNTIELKGVDSEGKPTTHQSSVLAIKDSSEIEAMHAHSLSEVSAGKEGMKVKIHSALTAIKQLGIMEGWEAASKYEHSGPDGKPIETTSDIDLARKLAFLLTKGDKSGE